MRARARWLLTVAVAAAVLLALAAPSQAHMLKKPKHVTKSERHHYDLRSLHHARTALRWYARHRGLTTQNYHPNVRRISRAAVRGHRWLKRTMKRRVEAYRERQRRAALDTAPPHSALWLCIHRGEGSWVDPNPPYFGGLQMGYSFMRAHAPGWLRARGTADHWTPNQQMWVAEIAVFQHGASLTGSWPNTAPPCL